MSDTNVIELPNQTPTGHDRLICPMEGGKGSGRVRKQVPIDSLVRMFEFEICDRLTEARAGIVLDHLILLNELTKELLLPLSIRRSLEIISLDKYIVQLFLGTTHKENTDVKDPYSVCVQINERRLVESDRQLLSVSESECVDLDLEGLGNCALTKKHIKYIVDRMSAIASINDGYVAVKRFNETNIAYRLVVQHLDNVVVECCLVLGDDIYNL